MTILYVNTGTSANAGNGDSIRLAFTKVNGNFAEIVGDIAALNAGGFTTITVATTMTSQDIVSTGTAYFNNASFSGTITGTTVFDNITVKNVAQAYQFIGTNINVTNAAFHDVAITGSLSGNLQFANLTVTNTLTVGTVHALQTINVGDYTIAQTNQYNDFSIIKNDVNGLALVLLNTQADSFNEIQLQDNISGGLTLAHQNSTNPSGLYTAGQNYIYGETPTDVINFGAYSDINFFASVANYNNPNNTYNNPLANISAETQQISFNTTVSFNSTVLGIQQGEIIQSATPPSPASTTTLWYDTITGRTYVYDNGWVDSSPSGNNVAIVSPPAYSTSTGFIGQIAHDATYVYICVGTSTWVRSSIVGGW